MPDIVGQIDLWSFFNTIAPQKNGEPPILLKEGNHIYKVVKGDVREFVVEHHSFICGDNKDNRGYFLTEINNVNCHDTVWNSDIEKTIFFNKEKAEKKAEEYLKSHDVVLVKDMNILDTVAFSYIRACDEREMIAFYCELDNGMLYMKEFMTYASLHLKEHKGRAIKKFMEQDEFKYYNPRQIQYVPKLKNMYRIKTKYDWDYSEASHSYATG